MNRRDFLKTSAAGGISAAIAGCSEDPIERLIPVLVPPEHYVPGKAVYYATNCRECSASCGLWVKTMEGRAVKIEGNPNHPFNQGKVCAIGQASLQGLYSPARVKSPFLQSGSQRETISWKNGISRLVDKLNQNQTQKKGKILFIGPPETGSLKRLITNSLSHWGGGDFLELDLSPVHSFKEANRLLFDVSEIPQYNFSKVDTIINFGSDFLESWLNPVYFSREFSEFHSLQENKKGRLFQVSPYLSLTGANADRWFSCKSGSEYLIAFLLADRLAENANHISNEEKANIRKWLQPILNHREALDLKKNFKDFDLLLHHLQNEHCVCLSGGNQTADFKATWTHVAVGLINYLTGAINNSIVFGENYSFGGTKLQSVVSMVERLNAGYYSIVLIHNANPIHALPHLDKLKRNFEKADFVVSFSTEFDETSEHADLHLPCRHYLESWNDSNPANAVFNLQQPVMQGLPGYQTKDIGDLLLEVSYLLNPSIHQFKNYREYLKFHWKEIYSKRNINVAFEDFWNSCLQRGGMFQQSNQNKVTLKTGLFSENITEPQKPSGLTLLAINTNLQNANGATGNKTWLLETPHPLSQTCWEQWIDIHPETAEKLKIKDKDLITISSKQSAITGPVRLYYGIAKNTVATSTGFGRNVPFPAYESKRRSLLPRALWKENKNTLLRVQKIGENVLSLFPQTAEAVSGDFQFVLPGIKISNIKKNSESAFTDNSTSFKNNDLSRFVQSSENQIGHGLIQTVPMSETGIEKSKDLLKKAKPVERKKGFYHSIESDTANRRTESAKFTPPFFDPYKWEMVVDLDKCTGCSACVIACYAENNIAVVGKERVREGREMSWLRIERFFEINQQTKKLESYWSPQMCSQCDNAGCEPVCPVSATYKTSDGLNAMIYNRCVGSRYCANNCIFGQRRFNWRSYEFPAPLNYQLNPDVTVRGKGVMEKCSFCQQRIREKTLEAKAQGRTLKETEIQTACQQTCPSQAIVFGNAKDPNSRINVLKGDETRSYTQFKEMNYRPAVTYLKKVLHHNQKA